MVKSAQDIGLIGKHLGLVEATQEFYKLQQQGKIITEEILPRFSQRLREFAAGGLANKLKGNTVAMGQMFNSLETTGEIAFLNLSDGLTDFFQTVAISVKELKPLWEGLGKIFGSVFKAISLGVKVVTPLFVAWGRVMDSLTKIMGDFSAIAGMAFGTLAVGKVLGFGKAMTMAGIGVSFLMKKLLGLVIIAGLVDEAMNLIYKDREGVFWSTDSEKARTSKPKEEWTEGDKFNQSLSNLVNPDYWSSRFSFDVGVGRGAGISNYAAVSSMGNQTQVNLYLDKEVVASGMVETAAMQGGIDNRVATLTGQ